MSSLRSLSVAWKIGLGFGFLVIAMIALGAMSWRSLGAIDAELRELLRVSDLATTTDAVKTGILADVGDLDDFVISAEESAGAEVRKRLDEDRKKLEELLTVIKNPQRVAIVRDAITIFADYSDAQLKATALSRKYDTERSKLTGNAQHFVQAANAITEMRVKRNNARGAAESAEILSLIGDGRRQVTGITNSAGPGLTPDVMKTLPTQMADAKKSWNQIQEKVQAAKGHAADEAEAKEFEKLAGAVNDYAQAFYAISPILAERSDLRMNKAKGASERLAARLTELANSARETAKESADAAITTSADALRTGMIVAIAGVLLSIGIAILIIRAIVPAVVALTGAMRKLADGDTRIEVPAAGRGDEIGAMAKTVQVFKDNAIRMAQMQEEQEKAKQQAEAEKKRMMAELADGFEASVSGVVSIVSSASTEMQATAKQMASTAEQTKHKSLTVASASEEASSNVQTVASAAEELSSSISEIGRQVAQSSRIVAEAAERGKTTDAAVQGLADMAQKIGEVVSLINDIAAQTNLLALNATIEAARAGEAGKGFAVVASEVKTLANQTAKATEEIGSQVSAIQSETQKAVEAIRGICATISEVNSISTSIASAIEEQNAATQEIARNVQQAAAGSSQVSENIDGVTQAATETGAAAAQVLGSAGELAKQSETLRHEVDKFLAGVRAA